MVDDEAEYERGLAAEDAGHFEEALAIYDALIPVVDDPDLLMLVRFRRAVTLLELERFQEALVASSSINRPRKAARMSAIIAGSAARELGRLDVAKESFARAVQLKKDPATLSLLADVHRLLGDDEESERCLRRALEIDPDYEEAHYNLGVQARFRRDYDEAERRLRRAIELDPSYAEAYAELGWVLVSLRRLDEAEPHLRRALALDPSRFRTHAYLGNLLFATGRPDKGEASYAQAVRIAPDDSTARWWHADVLRALGHTVEAERELRAALARDPSCRPAHQRLARLLDETGREGEAREHHARADELADRDG